MSVVAERAFVVAPQLILLVGVPAVLWGLAVAGGAAAGRRRTYTFLFAAYVGGFGLILGIGGLTFVIPDDTPYQLFGGPRFQAGMYALGGAALLSIAALTGFVALFLRQRPWGQPSYAPLGMLGSTAYESIENDGVAPVGVVVEEITPNSAADDAGISPGQVITAADGVPVRTLDELITVLRPYSAGQTVTLDFVGADSVTLQLNAM